jgi:hypothetical protein
VTAKYPAPDLDADLRLATVLLAAPAAGHLLGYLFAVKPHLADQTWPAHARFHALQSVLQTTGWDLCVLAAAIGPFQRRKAWTLWIFLGHLLAVQAGYFASAAIIPAGRPASRADNVLYAISTAMSAAGLAAAWQQLRHRPPHGQQASQSAGAVMHADAEG